jgi:ArsR family transcriptional regulator
MYYYISLNDETIISNMKNVVKKFKALADTNRVRILKMLEVRPLCVCEITEILQLATSTVSKHLSILKDAEFIHDQKEARWVNYYLNDDSKDFYVNQLLPLIHHWLPDDDTINADRMRVNKVDRNVICGI